MQFGVEALKGRVAIPGPVYPPVLTVVHWLKWPRELADYLPRQKSAIVNGVSLDRATLDNGAQAPVRPKSERE